MMEVAEVAVVVVMEALVVRSSWLVLRGSEIYMLAVRKLGRRERY